MWKRTIFVKSWHLGGWGVCRWGLEREAGQRGRPRGREVRVCGGGSEGGRDKKEGMFYRNASPSGLLGRSIERCRKMSINNTSALNRAVSKESACSHERCSVQ